jgi:hypothetical protein
MSESTSTIVNNELCNQAHIGNVSFIDKDNNPVQYGVALGFLNSMEINVFPCSRRNSSIIETHMEGQSHYYFPYDPEARLTTEANKIKETSLNGFTQTYIKSVNLFSKDDSALTISKLNHTPSQENPSESASDFEKSTGKNDVNFSTLPGFNFVIGGYNFNIPLNNPKKLGTLNELAQNIMQTVQSCITNDMTGETWSLQRDSKKLYANIRLVNTPLYSLGDSGTVLADAEGNSADTTRTIVANTWVLRDQFAEVQVAAGSEPPPPAAHLDALKTGANTASAVRNLESYYFSGLSFSAVPLTGLETTSYSEFYLPGGSQYDQRIISILLLENKGTRTNPNWVVNQRALLPNIWHGEEEDSVEVGNFRTHGNLEIDGDVHITGHILANTNTSEKKARAQFYDVNIDHNLDVDGMARIDNDFYVGGQTLLNGDVHLKQDLQVDQDTKVRNLTVSGTPAVGSDPAIPGKIQSGDILTTNIHVTGFASRLHKKTETDEGTVLGFLTAEVITEETASDGDAAARSSITTGSGKDRVLGYRTNRNAKRLILHAKNKQAPAEIEPNNDIEITESTANNFNIYDLKFSLAEGASEKTPVTD